MVEFVPVACGRVQCHSRHVIMFEEQATVVCAAVRDVLDMGMRKSYDGIIRCDPNRKSAANRVAEIMRAQPFRHLELRPPEDISAMAYIQQSPDIVRTLRVVLDMLQFGNVAGSSRCIRELALIWPSICTWLEFILPVKYSLTEEILANPPPWYLAATRYSHAGTFFDQGHSIIHLLCATFIETASSVPPRRPLHACVRQVFGLVLGVFSAVIGRLRRGLPFRLIYNWLVFMPLLPLGERAPVLEDALIGFSALSRNVDLGRERYTRKMVESMLHACLDAVRRPYTNPVRRPYANLDVFIYAFRSLARMLDGNTRLTLAAIGAGLLDFIAVLGRAGHQSDSHGVCRLLWACHGDVRSEGVLACALRKPGLRGDLGPMALHPLGVYIIATDVYMSMVEKHQSLWGERSRCANRHSASDGSSDSAHDGAAVSRAGSRQVHFMSIWAEWAALQSAKAYKLRRHHTRRVQLDLTEPGQVVQDLGTNRRHCTSEPIVVVRVVSALLSTRAHKVGITFRVFPDGELSGQFQTLTDVETARKTAIDDTFGGLQQIMVRGLFCEVL
ncbi:hypothetical protein FB107DRAFT_252366 [Schizophyllum commune]